MSANPPISEPTGEGPSLELRPAEPTPKRKQRWQTRALYWILGISVAIYLLSQLGLSLPIPQAPRSEENEKMVATAKLFGGGVHSKGVMPGWEGWVYPEDIQIDFYSPHVDGGLDDNGLAKFAEDAGRGPTGLYLNETRISGSGLRKLGGLTRLEAFTVSSKRRRRPAPTSDDPEPTSRSELQIGRGDLAGLNGLPKLRMVYIAGAGFSADAFRGLPPAKMVQTLVLRGSDVPDEALADLAAAFPNLRHLNLSNTGISDSGLKHLAKMKALDQLSLGSNGAITAEGLKALKDVAGLKLLDLTGSRFVPADVAELREAKPYLIIEPAKQFGNPPGTPAR